MAANVTQDGNANSCCGSLPIGSGQRVRLAQAPYPIDTRIAARWRRRIASWEIPENKLSLKITHSLQAITRSRLAKGSTSVPLHFLGAGLLLLTPVAGASEGGGSILMVTPWPDLMPLDAAK